VPVHARSCLRAAGGCGARGGDLRAPGMHLRRLGVARFGRPHQRAGSAAHVLGHGPKSRSPPHLRKSPC
jgi:hypothetical protein